MLLSVALPASAGGPVRQQSADDAESFLGIIIHGAMAANDAHSDPFGGVNWVNRLSLLGFDRTPPGGPRQDTVILTLGHLTHQIAPHGEAAGPNFAPSAATIVAPANRAPQLDAKRIDKAHATHEDQVALVVLGAANAGQFTGYLGLVAALHVVPDGHFFVISELRGERRAREESPTGLAALLSDSASTGASLALGVLGDEVEIEDVKIHLGATDEAFSVGTNEFPASDGGAGGVARLEVPKELIASALAGEARIRVITNRGTLAGRLGRIDELTEAKTRPPYCRATASVVVRQGAQGAPRDHCSKVVAQAEAFDAASGSLCGQAQCAGNCRVEGTECQPQIPLLPDPADFVCWKTENEDCEGGFGWRCFWSSPQWFQCSCACR
jgi:hypothetical protein